MSASRQSEVHASAFSDFMRWTCARLQSVGKCGLLRRLSLFRPTSCESLVGRPGRIRTDTTRALNALPLPIGPLVHMVARAGFEPARLSTANFESAKSSIPSSGVINLVLIGGFEPSTKEF